MKILSETTYFATSAIILRRYVTGAVCLQAKPVDGFHWNCIHVRLQPDTEQIGFVVTMSISRLQLVNKSVCSASYAGCQHDTTHICGWYKVPEAIIISCLQGAQQQTRCMPLSIDGQTDGWTLGCFIGPTRHTVWSLSVSWTNTVACVPRHAIYKRDKVHDTIHVSLYTLQSKTLIYAPHSITHKQHFDINSCGN